MFTIALVTVVLLAIFSPSLSFRCSLGVGVPCGGRLSRTALCAGRSKEDQKFSSKALFRKIRDQLNEAATEPGFLPVDKDAPELEVYCRSDKSGKQHGSCPDSQFVQMVLLKKGIKYAAHFTHPSKIPDWIESYHGGQLPVILHQSMSIAGPMEIAEYIESTFPQNSLTRQGILSYQEVLEKTKNFFPSAVAFILNKDKSKDEELQSVVENELNEMEKILISTPGRFFCGVEMTLADLYLLPQLFHAMVGMEHFKDYEAVAIDYDSYRPVLDNYVNRMLDLPEFNNNKVYCGVDKSVFGWKVLRGTAKY